MVKNKENLITLETARQDTIDTFGEKINELNLRIKSLDEKSKSMKFILDIGQIIVIGVIIVLFIAIVGLLIDAYIFHAQSYKDLKISVDEMKKDLLNKEYESINNRINNLEKDILINNNPLT